MVTVYTEEALQQLNLSKQQYNQIGMIPKETVEKLVKASFFAGARRGMKFYDKRYPDKQTMAMFWYCHPKDLFSPEAWEDVP